MEADFGVSFVDEGNLAKTERTYAHVTKQMDDKATATLDTLFAGGKNKGSEAI